MIRALSQDQVNEFRQAIALAVEETGLQMIAMYLHGSYGTVYMRDDSDIDLAFLAKRPLKFEESIAFSVALEKAWRGDHLDIADLRQCDTVFLAQVVTDGLRIYTGDELAAQCFEMTVLSKYARLNEERAGIIADIKLRGKVYGSEARPG